MYKLELTKKSEEKLNLLKITDLVYFNSIILELRNLQNNFPNITNVKNI